MRGNSIVLGFMLREANGKCQLNLRLEYLKFLETFKGKITGQLGKRLRNTLCSYLENGKTHTPILFVYGLGGAKRKTNGCPGLTRTASWRLGVLAGGFERCRGTPSARISFSRVGYIVASKGNDEN